MKSEEMSAERFIKLCVKCGYGNPDSAGKYVKENPKEFYTTDDFIKLYHKAEHFTGKSVCGSKEVYGMYGKTTAMSFGY